MRWFDKKTVVMCVAFITVFLLVVSAARLQNRYPLMASIAATLLAPLDYVFSGIAGGVQQRRSAGATSESRSTAGPENTCVEGASVPMTPASPPRNCRGGAIPR